MDSESGQADNNIAKMYPSRVLSNRQDVKCQDSEKM